MHKFLLAAVSTLVLTACGVPSNGLFVSDAADPLGGNLFVETVSDGGQVLVLDGEITPETAFYFQSLVETSDVDGLIITQSPGGSLLASHQIGRDIARNRINTAVLVTCYSACVDIFIAGRNRTMAEDAELGLHSAAAAEFGYKIDKPYWESFGFGAVNEAAYKVPFDDIWIIDAARARELRLATEILR